MNNLHNFLTMLIVYNHGHNNKVHLFHVQYDNYLDIVSLHRQSLSYALWNERKNQIKIEINKTKKNLT